MSKMHYFSNKSSKIAGDLRHLNRRCWWSEGLRDLVKLCFFKLIITESTLKTVMTSSVH